MPQSGDASFLYLLKRVELAARRRLEEVLEPSGVTAVQYAALTSLERHADMTAAALARHSFVTAQTTAQLVRSLEQRGLIARHPDPRSRRQVLLALTPRGRHLLDELREPVAEIEQLLTSGVSREGLEQFRGALESFRAAVEP